MSTQEIQLETILRGRKLAWAIDMFSPSSQATIHYLAALRRLEEYITRRNLDETSFTPDSLEDLISESPYKADAFLQALVSIRSTPILCAAWRIVQGIEVESIKMHYARLDNFSLQVVLRSPYGQLEEYSSNDINDVVFIRHLAKSSVNDRPFFDGFYALRQT